MMVLITYDVNVKSDSGNKRLYKIARECMNYGQRVQNSVFECVLNEAQFIILKNKILSIINYDLDSVRFYFLGNNWERRIEFIGRKTSFNVTDELII
jgi:CRISPR-associated protein Cas2